MRISFFSLFPVIFGKVITGHIALMPQVKLIFCLQRPRNSNNNNSSSISKHGLNEERQQQLQKKEERRGRDRETEIRNFFGLRAKNVEKLNEETCF